MHIIDLATIPDLAIALLLDWTDTNRLIDLPSRPARLEWIGKAYRDWVGNDSDRVNAKFFSSEILKPGGTSYTSVSQHYISAAAARGFLIFLEKLARQFAEDHGSEDDLLRAGLCGGLQQLQHIMMSNGKLLGGDAKESCEHFYILFRSALNHLAIAFGALAARPVLSFADLSGHVALCGRVAAATCHDMWPVAPSWSSVATVDLLDANFCYCQIRPANAPSLPVNGPSWDTHANRTPQPGCRTLQVTSRSHSAAGPRSPASEKRQGDTATSKGLAIAGHQLRTILQIPCPASQLRVLKMASDMKQCCFTDATSSPTSSTRQYPSSARSGSWPPENIFGLATSPREWWQDLQKGIFQVHLKIGDKDYAFDQCPLDPCIFMLREMKDHRFIGEPIGYLGTHVDDILVVASGAVSEMIRKSLSSAFAIDRWEIGDFSYVGSEISCKENEVTVTQTKYVESRLFLLEIPRHLSDEEPASFELKTDNQSLIGALSWLSAQTRPDSTCSVSLAQQLQKSPTVGDARFTNQVSQRATMYKDRGLTFKPIDEEHFGILVYHDAAWANALEAEHDEPYFELTPEDREAGLQKEGPFAEKVRKAKRVNSKVASQLGGLTMFADMRSLTGVPSNATIGDWRSKAGQRVCRSTFGAETQACVEGGQYLRSFYETVKTGELVTIDRARTPLLCLSDCRSLYDHVHKEGVPRVPTDRRLAIDLAALRQNLRAEQWSTKLPPGWVPSGLQYGDILTKPSDPKDWWDMISTPLVVPIDIGEVTCTSTDFGEKKTSVKHQDRMSSWIRDCSSRSAV
ncbi:GIP [Symbiodinium sp. CCMP2592]|nr:GIP [Symbiodinium sp. CCMP2592]